MPVFVHLTSHRNVPSIRRGGIALRKRRLREVVLPARGMASKDAVESSLGEKP